LVIGRFDKVISIHDIKEIYFVSNPANKRVEKNNRWRKHNGQSMISGEPIIPDIDKKAMIHVAEP
jgi:hypothetical protein